MKLKKKVAEFIYLFLNHKNKRRVFKQTFDCKLLSSKSLIFFANKFSKDLRSSSKFFISGETKKFQLNYFDIIYVSSDALEDFVSQIKKQKKKFILITGDSDRSVTKNLNAYKTILKNSKKILEKHI